ncbi:tRNA (N6-isopentenyl adenosine(37)-C2)-methylthiotransferase MiaB [soil metagenome]|nr:tRNA (N6-isopentenyl adenosine(37)-C2)-methylthiotransferase MiaB [Trueperaceae bacterium]
MRAHVITFGCQMNEYDTLTIQSELVAGGHELVDAPQDANLILLNTCAVRGKPIEKVVSLLGDLRKERRAGRDVSVALMGCLAQLDEGKAIAEKFEVDALVGPGAITDVLEAIEAIEEARFAGERAAFESLRFREDLVDHHTPPHEGALTGFLTIMRGCDHHCTYCIVPTTRGPEVSRPLEAIVREAEAMARAGVQEVYLLGQNVNSYGLGDASLPSFAELLRTVARVGIPRVKFTTSHPMNFTSDVIDAIAEEEAVCNYIHLPVQSGSDRVLRRMAREYGRERYLDIVREIRAKVPDVVLSTDIIVGFPGETEEDFSETLSLFDEVAFEHAYTFIYSARPGTPSHRHFDDMPKRIKTDRLARLIELQKAHSLRANGALVGRELRVLVKEAARDGDFVMGHSDQQHTVLVPKDQVRRLGLHSVRVDQATPHTLYGSVVGADVGAVPLRLAS